MKKYFIPFVKNYFVALVLFAFGASLALVAFFAVYPRPETGIPVPAYSHIQIWTNAPISEVGVTAAQETPTKTVMSVIVYVAKSAVPPEGLVGLTLPYGATFFDCAVMPKCENYANLDQSSAIEPVVFKSGTTPNELDATNEFAVNAPNFAEDFNGTNAYAAIPEVTLYLPGGKSESPNMLVTFDIPAASTYDWSSLPNTAITSPYVVWKEALAKGDTPGRTAVGINHSRQANDATLNFTAGALIGVAGGAIVSGFQETMDTFKQSRERHPHTSI